MSLKSWKAEFYPEPADEAVQDAVGAVEHSLRKWRGLTKGALERHELKKDLNYIRDAQEHLVIDAESCALCQIYIVSGQDIDDRCGGCPLMVVRGGVRCDDETEDEPYSPYHGWSWAGPWDPGPMVEWLEKALELAIRDAKKDPY